MHNHTLHPPSPPHIPPPPPTHHHLRFDQVHQWVSRNDQLKQQDKAVHRVAAALVGLVKERLVERAPTCMQPAPLVTVCESVGVGGCVGVLVWVFWWCMFWWCMCWWCMCWWCMCWWCMCVDLEWLCCGNTFVHAACACMHTMSTSIPCVYQTYNQFCFLPLESTPQTHPKPHPNHTHPKHTPQTPPNTTPNTPDTHTQSAAPRKKKASAKMAEGKHRDQIESALYKDMKHQQRTRFLPTHQLLGLVIEQGGNVGEEEDEGEGEGGRPSKRARQEEGRMVVCMCMCVCVYIYIYVYIYMCVCVVGLWHTHAHPMYTLHIYPPTSPQQHPPVASASTTLTP